MNNSKIEFDPVKEEKDGVLARRAIWSTVAFNRAIEGLNEGRKLSTNPFFMNNIKLAKAELVFQRTPEEIEEFRHCMQDIVYFANKYCKLMTPLGVKNIVLRDYQKRYLKHVQDNRLSIYLACRQCGKCLGMTTEIEVKLSNEYLKTKFERYITNNNTYNIPIFEIYNLFDSRIIWRLKYKLYKILYELKKKDYIIENIIAILDKFEREDEKLIHSFEVDGIEINTDTGFKPLSDIHLTRRFQKWQLVLENGLELDCADTHIVFGEHMEELYVKDLFIGTLIQTEYGLSAVKSIEQYNVKLCMVDVTVKDDLHRFYSNHILSHNTTTSAIFMLWYILFNVDKNALVLGNKLKTAVEILDKLRSIYMELPFFLKPGIRKWNQGELAFDNGCRIMAEATTINSGIGFTFHCVLADEFAHIPPNILDSFYNNLFPVVTAARARFMITSTQNGYNLMQRLYVAAVNGENEYAPFKTDWDEVPEWDEKTRTWRARDDEWYRLQVANYGSEEAFNAQFGTQFCIKSKTLISPLYIKKHSKDARAFVQNESVIYGDNWFFDPQYDISRLHSDRFVFTCDISEGTGVDYTVFAMFTVHKSEKDESPIFTNVGYYASARASIDENIEALANFCNSNLSQDHYIISIEYNLYGELFYRLLMSKLEHASGNEVFDETVFVKYKSPTSEKMIPGVKITINSKKLYCNIYKQLFETGHIISPSLKYVTEMQNFVDKKENGSYEAVTGHDDLMMTHIQLAAVKETTAFKYFIDEMTSSNSKENEVDMYELMNMANEQFALQQPFQDDIYGIQ